MFRKKQIIELLSMMVGVVLSVTMSSCTPRAVREAESVVTQADSLWQAGKMYGVDEGDSVSLAQAYETLQEHSAFSRQLSDVCPFVHCTSLLRTYSHACYHYGKLLRAKGSPVEAMQVFIAATHSHTRDYHILGRVYNNIGDICHLAGDFPLSYDMFEQSANMYLENGDTLLYYYCLNDMAYELAEQSKKDKVLSLLSEVEARTTDQHILTKVYESRVRLYYKISQYDSVVQIINRIDPLRYKSTTGYALQAQALWHLGKRDSALVIAKQIMGSQKASNEDKYNTLYIIINGDTTLLPNKIKELSEQRADLETQLLVPLHKQNAVAVNILHEDLSKEANLTWLYSVSITILIISSILILYVYRKRRQHALLSQQMADLTVQNKEAETQHKKIIGDIEKHKRIITDEVEKNCKLIIKAESFPQNIYWNKYKKMCSIVDKRFYMLASKLQTKYKLNETETRLCVLTLLDCKYDLIADLLYRSNSSIGTLKIRVAKKLGTTAKDLRMYLVENECIN